MATIYLNDGIYRDIKNRGQNPSSLANKLCKEYLMNDYDYNHKIAMAEFNLALEELRKYRPVEVRLD